MTELSALSWIDSDGDFERKWDWRAILNQGHVWITRDGRVQLIEQLDDDHLLNVLPWALDHARWREQYPESLPLIQALRLEIAKRGLA